MTAVVYPSIIARACSALDESPIFRDLPDGYFRVIIRIIKKINLSRLVSPILASRSTLAQESGKSVETVQRAIKWLEDRGLVQRSQKARIGLRGSSSPLIPTAKLLDALLLTSKPVMETHAKTSPIAAVQASRQKESYPQPSQRSSVSADCSKSTSQKLSNLSENSRTHAGAFVKIEKVKLPVDLAWMVKEKGMKATGVLSLMRKAKDAKQKLSDVVAATRKYLQDLEGRSLYAYLVALIGKNHDYSYQANEVAKLATAQQTRERLERKALELVGRRYTTKNGKIHVLVEPGGMLLEIREGRHYGQPMSQEFLDALEDGRLMPLQEEFEY